MYEELANVKKKICIQIYKLISSIANQNMANKTKLAVFLPLLAI